MQRGELAIRDMKRLIDAVMTMPNQSDRRAQTEWLLGASRSLLHASNVVLARLENLIDGQDWRARWFAQQGFRDDALIQPHLDQRLCLDPSEPVFRRIDGDHVVRIRQELVADDIWYASPHVMEVRRAWDVDHCMYSTIYLDDAGNATCLCAFRQWGDKTPFTARDALMLEILHASFAKRVKEVDDVPGGPFTLFAAAGRGAGLASTRPERKRSRPAAEDQSAHRS